MHYFVIGPSRSGKSTLARRVSEKHGMQLVSAGEWVRRWYLADGDDEVSQRQVEALTDYAVAILRAAPRTSLEYMRENYDLTRPTVFEGIRNPMDFCGLFDPSRDWVVRLAPRSSEFVPTVFEGGVEVIDAYLRWAISARLMDGERYEVQEYDSYDEITCP